MHPLADSTYKVYVECEPVASLTDLILAPRQLRIFQELVAEHLQIDKLSSYDLAPRHKILLVGPPGNGKTLLAEAIASEMQVPLVKVPWGAISNLPVEEYTGVVYGVFERARESRCVVFFDGFQGAAAESEAIEFNRALNVFMCGLDLAKPSSPIICAASHIKNLGEEILHRFQLALELPLPGDAEIAEWFRRFEARLGIRFEIDSDELRNELIDSLRGSSYADLSRFSLDIHRRYVLGLGGYNIEEIVESRLDAWKYYICLGKHSG